MAKSIRTTVARGILKTASRKQVDSSWNIEGFGVNVYENWGGPEPDSPLQLYDLAADIGEKNNVAAQHSDVVARLIALARLAQDDMGDYEGDGRNNRPAGWVEEAKPLVKSE